MKTKKLISKVNRYLVLSKEFEQDVDILFEDRAVDATSMCITTTGTSFIDPGRESNALGRGRIATRSVASQPPGQDGEGSNAPWSQGARFTDAGRAPGRGRELAAGLEGGDLFLEF